VRIFGIDPGSERTGYGCVESDGRRHVLLACGAVAAPPGDTFPNRLARIHSELSALLTSYRPDCVAIENLFHAANVRSALKLGHARGVAMLAAVAIADYFFQYRQWFERQKMSLQEIKDEYKQSEGDPHIKGRIRQLRMAQMKKRMMTAVPKASVIITNPTHYSVALSYDRGMSAPVCVAKGVDNIALKIREIAGKHDIPIVENVPLARALYATVDIDEEIPVEHYHAVAEIIGYVMGLKRGLAGRRM